MDEPAFSARFFCFLGMPAVRVCCAAAAETADAGAAGRGRREAGRRGEWAAAVAATAALGGLFVAAGQLSRPLLVTQASCWGRSAIRLHEQAKPRSTES